MTSQQIESTTNPTAPPTSNPPAPQQKKESPEFEPPAASVRRLLKNALPKSTNVSKDSCAAITRACGIFVLYLTSCANDLAREGRRTTVTAKDVLSALQELDFEELMPQMEKFLEQHRKEEKTKKEGKEKLKAAKKGEEEKKDNAVADQAVGEQKEQDTSLEKEEAVEGVENTEKHDRDEEDVAGSPLKKQKLED